MYSTKTCCITFSSLLGLIYLSSTLIIRFERIDANPDSLSLASITFGTEFFSSPKRPFNSVVLSGCDTKTTLKSFDPLLYSYCHRFFFFCNPLSHFHNSLFLSSLRYVGASRSMLLIATRSSATQRSSFS
jgi:hypothetical protein